MAILNNQSKNIEIKTMPNDICIYRIREDTTRARAL